LGARGENAFWLVQIILERNLEKDFQKKKKGGAVHWRAGANQPAQPAKPAQADRAASTPSPRALGHGRAARARPRQADGAAWTACAARRRHDPPPPLRTAPPPSPFSPPPGARPLALSRALLPPLRAHRAAARHWSSPSSARRVPGTPSPLSASFHLSELRIRLRVLGRSFFAQVSGSSEPNRSPESPRPRRSSPRRRHRWFSPSRTSLASLARALWSSWLPESREAALERSTGAWWPAPLRQRRRSAIAGGQLAVRGFRASKGVGSSRKREANVLVPLVPAERHHRRRAVVGDPLPSRCPGQRARLAGGSARQRPRVHCTGCT
jgi:hypothetical protein